MGVVGFMKKLFVLFLLLHISITGNLFAQDFESYDVIQGKRFFEKRDYISAVACFSNALIQNDNDADAYFFRGITYYTLNKYNDAINDFNRLLRMRNIKAYQIYDGWMYRSKSYMNLGNYEEAINGFTEIIIFTTENIIGAKHYNLTEAIKLFNETLEEAYYRRGTVFYTMGTSYFNNAENDFKESLDINPNQFEANHSLGVMYVQSKRYKEAISPLINALQIYNNYASTYFNLGIAYYYIGEEENAIKNIEMAVIIEPNNIRYKGALDILIN